MASSSNPRENWHPARLIPTVGIKGQEEQERRATSSLLAVMRAVPEFGHGLLKELGAPKSPTIETYTVFHHRDGTPRAGVVVARTPAGARTLAHVSREDRETIARLTDPDSEPVGARGWVESAEPLALWRFA